MNNLENNIKQNLNQYHLIMGVLLLGFFVVVGTFSYWQWQTLTEQQTSVSFQVDGEPFSCSADGGNDISSEEVYIAPTVCSADSPNVIKREITLNTEIETANTTVFMDAWLNIETLGEGLSESDNFMYALTTGSSSCTDGRLSSGNFKGLTEGDKVDILTNKIFTETSTDTVYLWIWLDAAETSTSTMDQVFNLQLGGTCTDKGIVLPDQKLITGTYTSSDGAHTINIASDNTIKYDNTYSLTRSTANSDSVITGSLGTNNKSGTFYMVNDTTLISSAAAVSYTHNSATVNLYGYTIFKATSTPVVDSNGIFEVWSNNTKVNSYADFQSAVDAASAGDTVKIAQNFTSTSGIYINKNLTIDGQEHYMFRSTSSNTAIVIEEGVDVTISNLTIDGGATGFEVDYDNLTYTGGTVPLKSDTLTKDPKLNMPAVISKGNDLTIESSSINNNYTSTTGAALLITDGTVTINNSEFNHNYATKGAALYAGRTFYSDETTYPVSNITITDSNFNNNYSTGDGGAMFVYNTSDLNILYSNYIKNITYNAKGAVLYAGHKGTSSSSYASEGHAKGLSPMNVYIESSLFEGNTAGNDGYAMELSDASFNIVNTVFNNNRGCQTTNGGSVGTISYYSYREDTEQQGYLTGCTFKGNDGPASIFGDHGTRVKLYVEDCKFSENSGNTDFLFYSANAEFINCDFNNEKTKRTVVDVRPRHEESTTDVFEPPIILFEDVTITNSYAPSDILIRRHGHGTTLNTAFVTLSGETNAEVHLWDNTYLTLNGVHTGDIYIDSTTAISNYTKDSGATLNGNLYKKDGTYTIDINYPGNSELYQDIKFLYLEANKTYTTSELLQIHQITKDGYNLEYYTNSGLTTAWDFTPNAHTTIYGKWVAQ